jgi:ATP-binding cassette subfamily B (MDR/TAP) protein 1
MTFSAFFIGFLRGWQLALVMLGSLPLLSICMFFFVWTITSMNQLTTKLYSECGAKAEEALSSIKTVKSLRGEEYEYSIYEKTLKKTFAQLIKYGILLGLSFGLFFFSNLGE